MANTIMYSRANLEDLIARINSLRNELSAVNARLGSVNTSSRAGGDVHAGSPVSLSGLAGARAGGGTVRDSLRSYRTALNQQSAFYSDLVKVLRRINDELDRKSVV